MHFCLCQCTNCVSYMTHKPKQYQKCIKLCKICVNEHFFIVPPVKCLPATDTGLRVCVLLTHILCVHVNFSPRPERQVEKFFTFNLCLQG